MYIERYLVVSCASAYVCSGYIVSRLCGCIYAVALSLSIVPSAANLATIATVPVRWPYNTLGDHIVREGLSQALYFLAESEPDLVVYSLGLKYNRQMSSRDWRRFSDAISGPCQWSIVYQEYR